MKKINQNKKACPPACIDGRSTSGRHCYTKRCRRGFSILEVVISMAVLTVGIVGAISLISSSLRHSIDSRDHVIASGLAQEGIELVRNVRDNNMASGAVSSFTNFTNSDNCRIDKTYVYSNLDVGQISYNNTPLENYFKLKYDTNNFYEHASGTDTKFQRRIKITNYENSSPSDAIPEGKIITSIVSWNGSVPLADTSACNTANKCVYVEDILTDWK